MCVSVCVYAVCVCLPRIFACYLFAFLCFLSVCLAHYSKCLSIRYRADNDAESVAWPGRGRREAEGNQGKPIPHTQKNNISKNDFHCVGRGGSTQEMEGGGVEYISVSEICFNSFT